MGPWLKDSIIINLINFCIFVKVKGSFIFTSLRDSAVKCVILPNLGLPNFNLFKTETGGDLLARDRRWRQR